MGNCTAPQTDTNIAINKQIAQDRNDEQKTIKLLLLGAGASGKSTLFKQTRTIYGRNFSPTELKTYTQPIVMNILESMVTLCQQSVQYASEDSTYAVSSANEKHRDVMLNINLMETKRISPEVAESVTHLWKDPAIRATYDRRHEFAIVDSAPALFEKATTIAARDYIPSYEDILHCRVRTTGIIETSFEVDGFQFVVCDVGGQRNERSKWIHAFEHVTAVLWVAAMNGYDQVCFEDPSTNRMHEALNLLEETMKTRWFRRTPVVLFLNKKDLFHECIKTRPLSNCFPEYTPASDPSKEEEHAKSYIRERFSACVPTNKQRRLWTHFCQATDVDLVRTIFDSVRAMLIRQAMSELAMG